MAVRPTVAIVGAGHAGRALGRLLTRAGYSIGSVVCATIEHAREAAAFMGSGTPSMTPSPADLLLLGVPDGAIETVAEGLRDVRGSVVAHLCGAKSSEVLAPLRGRGAAVGALHPLRSFADPAAAAEGFGGTYCAVDGDPRAVETLERAVEAIGGRVLRVDPAGKRLYHAGAVFASNYLVALLEASLRLFEEAGVARADALAPLLKLAGGTLENAARAGIPGALSGPIERGDAETVRRQIEDLRERLPGLAGLYADLARLTCEVALAKGSIDRRSAGSINAALGTAEAAGIVVARPRNRPGKTSKNEPQRR